MSSEEAPNVVLVGFMGTGKSSLGRRLAARLQRPFLDLDDEVVARAGKPIPRIFAEDGEPAFRALESAAVSAAAARRGQVLATGGGVLLAPQNRRALLARGRLICLRASPATIARRLAGDTGRPLLGADEAAIAARLAERAPAYDLVLEQLDTDGLSPDQALDALCALLERPAPRELWVDVPGRPYPIALGAGLLSAAGRLLRARLGPRRLALISHPALLERYGGPLRASLEAAGFTVTAASFPAGEEHKTLATVSGLYDALLAAGLDRSAAVVALGGGVAGDVAGFVAATFLRGVPFVQVPTSLLAMVDASVGGKTGVDLPQGKNLVGAFKQPELVLIDPALLETLPDRELRSGLAEVVKHGMIAAPALLARLEAGPGATAGGPVIDAALLADAVAVKAAIVAEDPLERGRRAVLNLGHTFGHAFERVSAYRIRHGEAVALGCLAATCLATSLGLCDAALLPRLRASWRHLGLPVTISGYDPDALVDAMATDKKRAHGRLRVILPRALGDVDVFDAPGRTELRGAFESVLVQAERG